MTGIETKEGAEKRGLKRSRREVLGGAMRLSAGVAMAGLASGSLARTAGAQDGSMTLTAGAAELFVSPGEAAATGAVASAAATRGLARVQAAAALAGADRDGETFAEGSRSLVAADPDRGAVSQSAVTVASALREEESPAAAPAKLGPAFGGRGTRGRARAAPGGRGGSGRTIQGGGGRRRRSQVATLPAAGIGNSPGSGSTLAGLASVAAGAGALLLRLRGEVVERKVPGGE